MKFLLVGNGGREHALAWKLSQSPLCEHLFVAPGNGGTESLAKTTNINIDSIDVPKIIEFAKQNKIDLLIPGPEAPLAMGLIDACNDNGINCFGPTQAASRLESSKTFCKQILDSIQAPTAKYIECNGLDCASAHLKTCDYPVVLKADGLASGKGVIIANNQAQAMAAAEHLFSRYSTQSSIIIEEFIEGSELSFICLCSGTNFITLASSQDYKKRDNNDKGPNTGGMGACSPAPRLSSKLQQQIEQTIIQPTLDKMCELNITYNGFLYCGIMLDKNKQPYVLEYNCRLGDPETQPLMLRLQSDLAETLYANRNGHWSNPTLQWDPRPALGVVLANSGYPGPAETGQIITGLERDGSQLSQIFQAGTSKQGEQTIASGGRVLCVTALGDTIKQAQQNAYSVVKKISWPAMFYRSDIGYHAIGD